MSAAGIPLQAFLCVRLTVTNGGSCLIPKVDASTTTTPLVAAQSGIVLKELISCPSPNSRPWGDALRPRGLEGAWTDTTTRQQGVSAVWTARDSVPLWQNRKEIALRLKSRRPIGRRPKLRKTQQRTAGYKEMKTAMNTALTEAQTYRGNVYQTYSMCQYQSP